MLWPKQFFFTEKNEPVEALRASPPSRGKKSVAVYDNIY